ncbi:MAG: type II toxin-antitoxin system death-on-curing family toxin [Acetobacteraceae bacterium]|nr:type II toxin-antitoxin system death-on-curing family toxin [Acetobacteraceae bacterium]
MTLWLSREIILAIHDEQIARHGGAAGLRDSGLLDSALARPINHAAYGEPDSAEVGAIYALAIARNHPFIDGNKRTAFMALVLFLALNGMEFDPPQVEATITTLTMAAGDLPDEDFIAWVRRHATTRP